VSERIIYLSTGERIKKVICRALYIENYSMGKVRIRAVKPMVILLRRRYKISKQPYNKNPIAVGGPKATPLKKPILSEIPLNLCEL